MSRAAAVALRRRLSISFSHQPQDPLDVEALIATQLIRLSLLDVANQLEQLHFTPMQLIYRINRYRR